MKKDFFENINAKWARIAVIVNGLFGILMFVAVAASIIIFVLAFGSGRTGISSVFFPIYFIIMGTYLVGVLALLIQMQSSLASIQQSLAGPSSKSPKKRAKRSR